MADERVEDERDDAVDDDALLTILQQKESTSAAYVHGTLGSEREKAMREYYRMPYGNEEDGWSTIVASDVQDTVEWILPSLLNVFTTTDKAVQFEPQRAEDVEGADQATDACNYVFYRQNNGFLTLYTAFKDALIARNCAVMWRKETKETVDSQPFKGASDEMLAMLLQEPDATLEGVNSAPALDPQTGQPMLDMMGQPVMQHSGRIKRVVKRQAVKVEAFSPEDLLVDREWTSPMLDDCPYVCRLMRVTLSDLRMMGFDVDDQDLRGSDMNETSSADASFRLSKVNNQGQSMITGDSEAETDDESMIEGWLRIEFVLADIDGDGIAERLCVYRLKDKILSKEVCASVPIATTSPVLNSHRWDGLSVHDLVNDLQKLHTELLRQTLNNLYLTNNPRKKVLTDANWSPLANIDDLLDSRPGGVLRMRDVNAIGDDVTPFAAAATMPMLEYVKGMREDRTGISRTSQGLNPDSLNNTATGRQIDQNASQQRIQLIARIFAETLVKPIFKGILQLLTDGDMQKIAFRLRDKFVEYDPNEWRDSYDMTINVGLGTGDVTTKHQQLMAILQIQQASLGAGMPFVQPNHLYHTAAKLVENAGFKDVQNFFQDPRSVPPAPKPPPIPVMIEQMRLQAQQQQFQMQQQLEVQKLQAQAQQAKELEMVKTQAKLQEIGGSLELQRTNDERDASREAMKAQMDSQIEAQKAEMERWKAELAAQTQIYIEQLKLGSQQPVQQEGDINDALAVAIDGFRAALEQMNKPKQIVRGPDGRAQGII